MLGVGTAMVYPTLLAAIGDVAHPTTPGCSAAALRLAVKICDEAAVAMPENIPGSSNASMANSRDNRFIALTYRKRGLPRPKT